jgi:hypothetical protein
MIEIRHFSTHVTIRNHSFKTPVAQRVLYTKALKLAPGQNHSGMEFLTFVLPNGDNVPLLYLAKPLLLSSLDWESNWLKRVDEVLHHGGKEPCLSQPVQRYNSRQAFQALPPHQSGLGVLSYGRTRDDRQHRQDT